MNLFKSLFGRPATNTAVGKYPPAGVAPIAPRSRRVKPPRPYHFTDPRMARGVQTAMERKQRPARLAFIYGSIMQGNRVRRAFRLTQLERRGSFLAAENI